MTSAWADTFTGPAGQPLNPAWWNYRTGRNGGDQATHDAAHAVLDGLGHLAVTADRDGVGGFVNGRVDTKGKVEFTPPCWIRASIRMPAGAQGVLPAFWTRGHNPNLPANQDPWLPQGEIDIVEFAAGHPSVTSSAGRRLQGPTLHGPRSDGAAGDVPFYATTPVLGKSDLTAGFHLYELRWHPDRMSFLVDGALVWDIHPADYQAAGGDWTPFSGAFPHYLILDVAVDAQWPYATDSSPFPAAMLVDWVRVDPLT